MFALEVDAYSCWKLPSLYFTVLSFSWRAWGEGVVIVPWKTSGKEDDPFTLWLHQIAALVRFCTLETGETEPRSPSKWLLIILRDSRARVEPCQFAKASSLLENYTKRRAGVRLFGKLADSRRRTKVFGAFFSWNCCCCCCQYLCCFCSFDR